MTEEIQAVVEAAKAYVKTLSGGDLQALKGALRVVSDAPKPRSFYVTYTTREGGFGGATCVARDGRLTSKAVEEWRVLLGASHGWAAVTSITPLDD